TTWFVQNIHVVGPLARHLGYVRGRLDYGTRRSVPEPLSALDVERLVHARLDVCSRGGAGRSIATHEMQLAVDDVASHSVTPELHGWQGGRTVQRRIIGFDRAEGLLELACPLLAARHVEPALVHAPRGSAARGRHGGEERTPLIGGRVVRLHNVGIARSRDERAA